MFIKISRRMILKPSGVATLLLALALAALGCTDRGAVQNATPTMPSITMIVNPNIDDVLAGQTVALSVDASGQDLRFKWSVARGALSAIDTPAVIYTAPNTPGVDTVTVEVSSASGVIVKSKSFKVVPPPALTLIPPATPTLTPVIPTATFTPSPEALCPGSTSTGLIASAWAAEGDPQVRLACAQVIINRWTSEADSQQALRLANNICKVSPQPGDDQAIQDFNTSYWAVNDVAIAWLLRGYALDSLGRTEEAILAYQTVIDKYSCGFAWNPAQGIFWNVAVEAQNLLP